MIRKLNNIKLSLAILTLFFGIYNNSKMALFFLTLLIFMNLIISNWSELEKEEPATRSLKKAPADREGVTC